MNKIHADEMYTDARLVGRLLAADTNPVFANIARQLIGEVLADHDGARDKRNAT